MSSQHNINAVAFQLKCRQNLETNFETLKKKIFEKIIFFVPEGEYNRVRVPT